VENDQWDNAHQHAKRPECEAVFWCLNKRSTLCQATQLSKAFYSIPSREQDEERTAAYFETVVTHPRNV